MSQKPQTANTTHKPMPPVGGFLQGVADLGFCLSGLLFCISH